jgi:3-phenylpropionate/cinnamic acid dioxygenase small subunit
MSDYESIRNLSYRYALLLDEGDFAGVADLLAGGALVPMMAGVGSEPITGREAIERFYADQVVTYRDGDPRTRHLISNQLIELADDGLTASSRCYFTVLQRPPRQPFQIVVGGQYHDRFDKVGGAWRFALKGIQVDHLNDIGLHFKIAPEHSAS